MPSVTRLYTAEDVRALPDDRNRYETIAGELFVTPAPSLRHQALQMRLILALGPYVERHHLGQLWAAPLDVLYGPMTLVEPDLVFVSARRREILTDQAVTAAPDLVVEILSPSTSRTDRGRKRALYQETGVPEYWIVDGEQNHVEIWRPGAMAAEVRTDAVIWQPDASITALSIELVQLFRAD